jgi:hypothetical protein
MLALSLVYRLRPVVHSNFPHERLFLDRVNTHPPRRQCDSSLIMSELLSVTASTIAIATPAYNSTKSLIDFIDSLKNAPKLISDLKGDVSAVQSVIRSLETMLENRNDTSLSAEFRVCLSSAKIPLEDCQTVSKDFKLKLKDWFLDSNGDRYKANSEKDHIEKFRTRMRGICDTLHLVLTVCSL